jgi:hypothetical protein
MQMPGTTIALPQRKRRVASKAAGAIHLSFAGKIVGTNDNLCFIYLI